jgi:DNA-binding MarR family transcriptional regulator
MNSSPSKVSEGVPPVTADDVADRLLQVVPSTMRRIRGEMRNANSGGLTVPQLRALLFGRRHPGAGLSSLAKHLGVSLPGASGLVDRLVRADLVERTTDPNERRRIQLQLTGAGVELVSRAHLLVRARLSADLAELPPGQLEGLAAALETLAGLAIDDRTRP